MPGCGAGLAGDRSFAPFIGDKARGTKCQHSSCQHRGKNGFLTNVDIVAEVKGCTLLDAALQIAEWFGEGAAASTTAKVEDGGDGDPLADTVTVFQRASHPELATRMLSDFQRYYDHVAVAAAGVLRCYQARYGVFTAVTRPRLERHIQCFDGAWVKTEKGTTKPVALNYSDIRGAIACAMSQADAPSFFDNAPDGIATKDCFLQITGDGVQAHVHSPAHRARISAPFVYEPTARIERFMHFLDDVFAGDSDAEQKKQILQEHAGAAILGIAPRYEVALVLVGDGANGKSTYIKLVRRLIAAEAVTSIPPQEFDNEYRRAMLRLAIERGERATRDRHHRFARLQGDDLGRPDDCSAHSGGAVFISSACRAHLCREQVARHDGHDARILAPACADHVQPPVSAAPSRYNARRSNRCDGDGWHLRVGGRRRGTTASQRALRPSGELCESARCVEAKCRSGAAIRG